MRTVHLVLHTTILFCRFLKIMELIIQEPGSSFKAFIPTIISICMEQIYPIIAEASIEPMHTYTNINTYTHDNHLYLHGADLPHHRRGEYRADAHIYKYKHTHTYTHDNHLYLHGADLPHYCRGSL